MIFCGFAVKKISIMQLSHSTIGEPWK